MTSACNKRSNYKFRDPRVLLLRDQIHGHHNVWTDTHHVPQNRIFQGRVANNQVEGIRPRNRIKLRFPLCSVQLKLVEILAIRFSHKHNLLARFLIMQPHKRLRKQKTNKKKNSRVFSDIKHNMFKALRSLKTNTGLIRTPHLVRGKLDSSVHVNQLKGHSKVLVAVCCEWALGFGRIVHPGSHGEHTHTHTQLDSAIMVSRWRRGWLHFSNLVVFVPMLWSLSTTDRSMLVTATSVDTFTFSYTPENKVILGNSRKQHVWLDSNSNLKLKKRNKENHNLTSMRLATRRLSPVTATAKW